MLIYVEKHMMFDRLVRTEGEDKVTMVTASWFEKVAGRGILY